jgi:hypothetical protein
MASATSTWGDFTTRAALTVSCSPLGTFDRNLSKLDGAKRLDL